MPQAATLTAQAQHRGRRRAWAFQQQSAGIGIAFFMQKEQVAWLRRLHEPARQELGRERIDQNAADGSIAGRPARRSERAASSTTSPTAVRPLIVPRPVAIDTTASGQRSLISRAARAARVA